MHRLEDMRYYGYLEGYGNGGASPMAQRVFEVDENGWPYNLVRVELRSADVTPYTPYRCECGDEIGSWEEARDHIELRDEAIME